MNIKCKDCGKEIESGVAECPYCGCVTNSVTQEKEESVPIVPTEPEKFDFMSFFEKNKNIIIVAVAVLLVVLLIVGISSCGDDSKNNNSNNNGGYSNDYNNNSNNTNNNNNNNSNNYNNTTDNSIQWISDRSVDYDETYKYHRVFFGLKNGQEEYISANSGVATIKITNEANEVVYSKSINFSSKDFSSWTNRYWTNNKWLACLYINDSELTKGSSAKGTLSLEVQADGVYFDANLLDISDLPTKGLSLKLPSTPSSFTDYDYNDRIEATLRVDSIKYTSTVNYDGTVTLKLNFTVTMTYNSTPGTSKSTSIGYKLKNSAGVIVDSGTIYVSQIDTGDTVLVDDTIFDLSLKDSYTLTLSNSSN